MDGSIERMDQMQVLANQMTRAEVDGAWAILRERSRRLRNKEDFKMLDKIVVGTFVSFEGRRGATVKGYVHKIGRSRVHVVATDGMRWSVAPSLLKLHGKNSMSEMQALLVKDTWKKHLPDFGVDLGFDKRESEGPENDE